MHFENYESKSFQTKIHLFQYQLSLLFLSLRLNHEPLRYVQAAWGFKETHDSMKTWKATSFLHFTTCTP